MNLHQLISSQFFAISLWLFALCLIPVAHAEDSPSVFHFQIAAGEEPQAAFGVVSREPPQKDTSGDFEIEEAKTPIPEVLRRPAEVKKHHQGGYNVEVALEQDDISASSTLSAVLLLKSGKAMVSTVRQLGAPTMQERTPECKTESVIKDFEKLAQLNEEPLRKVLKIREQRQALLSSLVDKLLVPEMLTKLSAMEKQFGIREETPFSRNLPQAELSRRLSVLLALSRGSSD